MTNLSEEIASLNQYIDAIEKFKTESFYRHVEAVYEKFKEMSLWISENKPSEILRSEYSNEAGYFHVFHCRNKQILDTFVNELESLFHY